MLAIEISNPSAGGAGGAGGVGVGGSAEVALGRIEPGVSGVRVLGVEGLRSGGPAGGGPSRGGHDDDLLPAIERLMTRCQVTAAELARVGVSAGPGGYTSLRIACAAGAMLAMASGCACVSVRSARVVYAGLAERTRTRGPIAVMLASKGATAWCEVFTPEAGGHDVLGEVSAEAAASGDAGLDGLRARGVRVIVGDQFLPGAVRAWASAAGVEVCPPRFSAEVLLHLTLRGEAIDPAALAPIYPREPDAVRLWRARAQPQGPGGPG